MDRKWMAGDRRQGIRMQFIGEGKTEKPGRACIWFERYEILKILGTGGTGKVYLAKDIRLGRHVAIKVLEKVTGQFHEEVQVLQKQGLSMLPVIYDAWIERDGKGIIIMEAVQGQDLREYLALHKQIPEKQVFDWGKQLGEFLQKLHGMNPKILYRDLKPENIIVRPDKSLRLVDVGAAVRTGENGFCQRMRIGTFGYASPEQWAGDVVDERTDIYSLGAVLQDLMDGMPEGMAYVAGRCLKQDRNKRYSTAKAFLEAWKRYRWMGRWWFIRNAALKLLKYGMLLAAGHIIWERPEQLTAVFFCLCGYAVIKILERIYGRRKECWEQKKSVWCRGWES